MPDERALATVTDYDEMIGALRARMAELGVTNETIGAIAGLAGGYVGKLLAPSRIKNLGPMSFGVMLQSLGLKLIVVEDAKTSAKMRPQWLDGRPFIVGEFVAHDSRLRSGSLNHAPGGIINPLRPVVTDCQCPDFTSAFGA
jgi:hypothetical protein